MVDRLGNKIREREKDLDLSPRSEIRSEKLMSVIARVIFTLSGSVKYSEYSMMYKICIYIAGTRDKIRNASIIYA